MASNDAEVHTLQGLFLGPLEARVFKLEESGRHFDRQVDELQADVDYLKKENTSMKKTLLPAVWDKLREHKAEVERLGTYMADIVEKAEEVSYNHVSSEGCFVM